MSDSDFTYFKQPEKHVPTPPPDDVRTTTLTSTVAVLKPIFDAMSKRSPGVINLEVTNDGLNSMFLDGPMCVCVALRMHTFAFDTYDFEEPRPLLLGIYLGLSSKCKEKDLIQQLRRGKAKDHVILVARYTEGADGALRALSLHITIVGGPDAGEEHKTVRVDNEEITLLDYDYDEEYLGIPDLTHNFTARVSTKELYEAVRPPKKDPNTPPGTKRAKPSEEVPFEATAEGLKVADVPLTCSQVEGVKPLLQEMTRSLLDFITPARNIAKHATVHMGEDWKKDEDEKILPMIISYPVTGGGDLRFFVAPRVNPE